MAAKDYEHLGRFIRTVYLPDTLDKDVPLDPEDWIREMGLTRLYGSFPENGALGEYFFSFGTSDILVEETDEILRGDIDPGTIIWAGSFSHCRGHTDMRIVPTCANAARTSPGRIGLLLWSVWRSRQIRSPAI